MIKSFLELFTLNFLYLYNSSNLLILVNKINLELQSIFSFIILNFIKNGKSKMICQIKFAAFFLFF